MAVLPIAAFGTWHSLDSLHRREAALSPKQTSGSGEAFDTLGGLRTFAATCTNGGNAGKVYIRCADSDDGFVSFALAAKSK